MGRPLAIEYPGALHHIISRGKAAMKVALYFSKRCTVFGNEQTARFFGGIHYIAVSKTYGKKRGEMSVDRKLSDLVDELDSHFKA